MENIELGIGEGMRKASGVLALTGPTSHLICKKPAIAPNGKTAWTERLVVQRLCGELSCLP